MTSVPRLRLRRTTVWAILAGTLALHLGVLAAGFQRLSSDDPARVMMALTLSPSNALEPWVWVPLHRWLLGLILRIHEDPIWVPRLLSIILSLGVMLVILRIASRITDDRRVVLLAALLALVTPYRLLIGSVPMADMLMLFLLISGAERVLAWLQEGRERPLLAGCALVGLATAVRYDAWFTAATLGLTLAALWWPRRCLSFGALAKAGLLLGWFPLFWIIDSWVWYGSLDNLMITPQEFKAIAGEEAHRIAWVLNPLGKPLQQELFWNPATWLGAAVLARFALRNVALRRFAIAFMTALPLMGLTMLATTAVSLAATWRLVGFWSLLLVPFGALALVRLADWIALRLRTPRAAPLAALSVIAVLLLATRDVRIARTEMWNWNTASWRHDAEAGRMAVAELRRLGGGRIVVDSVNNVDFLDVMVESGAPRLFITSANAPANAVALYGPMAREIRQANDTAKFVYLEDHFDLAEGGNPSALAANNVRLALVREAQLRASLDGSAYAELVQSWPDWALYRFKSGTAVSGR